MFNQSHALFVLTDQSRLLLREEEAAFNGGNPEGALFSISRTAGGSIGKDGNVYIERFMFRLWGLQL